MDTIRSLLSSPLWQGIQGFLAIIALIVSILLSLPGTQRFLGKYAGVKSASRVAQIPWTWIFMALGVAAGVSIAFSYQDVYRGLSVALGALSVGLAIKWLKSRHAVTQASSEFSGKLNQASAELRDALENKERMLKILRRFDNLEQTRTDFQLIKKTMTHTIDANGDGTLKEEVSIVPTGTSYVYFYFLSQSVVKDPTQPRIEASAQSLTNNVKLEILELERSDKGVIYGIVLDPPSTAAIPQTIEIQVSRPAIWKELVRSGADEGYFKLTYPTKSVQLKIQAPPGKTWKAIDCIPLVGVSKLEPVGHPSQIVWQIDNPTAREYKYKVFI